MESNKTVSSSDEIDFTQIFRWIGSGFTRIGNATLRALAGLRRLFISNIIYFSIIMISSLVLGLIYSQFLEKKYYNSSMIISCEYLNIRIVDNIMDKLNLLCNEEDRQGLAELLNVDLATAKNIVEFKAKHFVSENDIIETEVLKEQLTNVAAEKKDLVNKIVEKLDIENKHSFLINVKVYNPGIVKKLDTAIVNYLRRNEYIKKRIANREESLLNRRNKLVRESHKLDSLKSVLYLNFESMAKQSREGSNNVILSDKYITDPMSLFKEDLNFNNEIRGIDKSLYLHDDFEVVDGLTTFKEPDNLDIKIILATALIASIVFGYLLIGLWKFNEFLASFE
ncbi:MAG TPA: hypothetical protein VFU05_06125 [Cyclobacteriaceae bacterium]|nr:hypothetical protein [Cyclobacteriaceae bacterium]